MAYKAFGVGDYIERGVRMPGTVAKYSARARVTVDGIEFTPKRKLYQGKPSAAVLAANNVMVQTLEGRPWPGSAGDRLSFAAPDKAPRVTPEGVEIRLAGPHCMREAQAAGLWPTEREIALQKQAEAKLANPEEYAIRKLTSQGVPLEKAKAIAKAQGRRHDLPNVDDLIASIATADDTPTKPSKGRKDAA